MKFNAANRRLAPPDLPPPVQGLEITPLLIVAEIAKSRDLYVDAPGPRVVRGGAPTVLRFANTSLSIDAGGGPTDDKPDIVASPAVDTNVLSSTLNIRFADTRCYLRHPDGYLTELGQARLCNA